MAKKAASIPVIANAIHDLLEPLDAEGRTRAVNAALTMLGDATINTGHKPKQKEHLHEDDSGGDLGELSPKGRAWMRKYKVSADQLAEVFDLDAEEVEVIADDVPGTSSKEKTINSYIMAGLGVYLKTGEVVFKDDAARAVCKHIGCLNTANHSSYMGSRKNYFGGTKKAGWKMSAPGLKRGAELVAAMTKSDE